MWASPLMLRGLAAAAALVVLVGGGVVLVNLRTSTAGPSSEGVARPNRPRPSTGAVGSAAAATHLRYRQRGRYLYANVVTSSANFTKATLPDNVRHQVASSQQVAEPYATAAPAVGRVPPTRQHLRGFTVGQLESCLSAVATTGLVELVEVARYQGAPATIIVLNPVGNAFAVIVVGETCGAPRPDIIARLSVPRR
jgi:hypothetical protein